MDKIKAFFTNKITQIVAWVILFLDIVVLFVGGITIETISSGVLVAGEIIAAVVAGIVFISSHIKK